MPNDKAELLSEVANYYTEKLAEHGETPRGVDWNGEESQLLRFEQLCKIIDGATEAYSLNDLGCGYGALLDFLNDKYRSAPIAALTSPTTWCGPPELAMTTKPSGTVHSVRDA